MRAKTTEAGTTSRAIVVPARTLESYRQVGLADAVVRRGRKMAAINLCVAGKQVAHAVFGKIWRSRRLAAHKTIFLGVGLAPKRRFDNQRMGGNTTMTPTLRAGLIGAGIGGASMFLLDPDRGARRRALLRDQAVRTARKTRDAAGATTRDLGNRLSGVKSRVIAQFADEAIDDRTLCARVRAALGHVTDHPRAICVHVTDGQVTLTGDALEADVPSVIAAVEGVRGVKGIQNEIRAHATADGISALQGGSSRPARWTTWARESWSPTAVLLTGAGVATGAVLIAAALARTNGHSSADAAARDARTARPSPEQEAAEAFETEIGILIVGTAPTESGTFGTDESSS
jgi:hypothetical protein